MAILGGEQLDHMVSVIGGLCCTPLALVFPPLLHLYSGALDETTATFTTTGNKIYKALDVLLATFGISMGLLATYFAISSW